MAAESEKIFKGVVDHIAVESHDLKRDASDYERFGFHLETLYDDWAMLRDSCGFGLALLGPDSRHPPHMGLRVETREELEAAAKQEGRPIKEHRDRSVSFYTKSGGGRALEVIYYPPDYRRQRGDAGRESTEHSVVACHRPDFL